MSSSCTGRQWRSARRRRHRGGACRSTCITIGFAPFSNRPWFRQSSRSRGCEIAAQSAPAFFVIGQIRRGIYPPGRARCRLPLISSTGADSVRAGQALLGNGRGLFCVRRDHRKCSQADYPARSMVVAQHARRACSAKVSHPWPTVVARRGPFFCVKPRRQRSWWSIERESNDNIQ